jgi:FtsH-binding integral membrane protein
MCGAMANDPRKTTFGWAAPHTDSEATEVHQVPPNIPNTQSHEWQQYLVAKAAWEQQQQAWQQQQYAQQQAYAQQQQAYIQQQIAYAQQQQAWEQQQRLQAQAQVEAQRQRPASSPPPLPQPAQAPQPRPTPEQQQLQAAIAQAIETAPTEAATPIELEPEPAPEPESHRPETLRTRADATVGVSDRVRFIRLTYLHLLFAILTFAGLEYLLNTNPFLVANVSTPLTDFALEGQNWGAVLLAFMGISWVADYWAGHSSARALQYLGLLFYVCAEALIFVPLLAIVQWRTAEILSAGGADPHILRDAAFTTIGVFVALTLSVFISRKDFSFMRSGLMMVTGASTALIFLAIGYGFDLGLAFSVGMVVLAGAYMLYYTSKVLAHYDPRSHVAASLALFSSVALMFWYIIRIFLRMRGD